VPAGQERLLRRRIRSVQSTQKITRAMELIAASRIVRAQAAISAARPYAEKMREVVSELSAAPEARGHWALAGQEGPPMAIVLGADRGLSGAFNASVLRSADELVRSLAEPVVVAVGRKAVSHFSPRERPLADRFEGFSDRPRFEDAQAVAGAVASRMEQGTVGEIYVVSTRFTSVGSQSVEARRLVPLGLGGREGNSGTTIFEIEPGPEEVLDRLLPRWLEAELYLALLESAASFHVAQQRAMKAATDNADKLIKSLRRAMNRARQDAITTEIMEIVGGAEALRQTGDGEAGAGRPDVYVLPDAT